MRQPRVSVLMPTFNCAKYLAEAIQSIRIQSFRDFELLIVDDCSTDHTPQLLTFFAQQDERIRITQNPINMGRGASRNKALNMNPSGEYIAIMDSDDIAIPERLEKQVNFLDNNPEIVAVGSQVVNVDELNNPTKEQTILPTSHGSLAWLMTYSVPFANPTVMLRAAAMRQVGEYDEDSKVEDAELWTRLIYHGRFANIPEILLHYRMPSERLKKRMEEWREPIIETNRKFMSELTGQAVSTREAKLIRQSIFREENNHTQMSPREYLHIMRLIKSLFFTMGNSGLITPQDSSEVVEIVLHQYRNLNADIDISSIRLN